MFAADDAGLPKTFAVLAAGDGLVVTAGTIAGNSPNVDAADALVGWAPN